MARGKVGLPYFGWLLAVLEEGRGQPKGSNAIPTRLGHVGEQYGLRKPSLVFLDLGRWTEFNDVSAIARIQKRGGKLTLI